MNLDQVFTCDATHIPGIFWLHIAQPDSECLSSYKTNNNKHCKQPHTMHSHTTRKGKQAMRDFMGPGGVGSYMDRLENITGEQASAC